ncbi:MAG: hypothetical protein K8S55_13200 [Phycisphaerae bacterium]|nr:hypothetical protein [Phycisphaerae bacterium]
MPESSQNDICARIAQVRLEVAGPRGKSSFAKQLGLSPSTYDYYEANRVPPAEVLVRITEIAGIDLRWLLTGESAAGPAVATSENLPIIQRAAELLGRHPEAAKPLAAFLDILAATMKFPAAEVATPGTSQPLGAATPADANMACEQAMSPSVTDAEHGSLGAVSPGAAVVGQEHLSHDSALRSGAVAGSEATATMLGTSHGKIHGPQGTMPPSAKESQSSVAGDKSQAGEATVYHAAEGSQSPGAAQSSGAVPPNPPADPASRWIPILGRSAAGVPAFWAVGDDTGGLTTLADLIDRYANTSQADLAVRPACQVDSPAADEPVQIISLRQPTDEQGPTEFVAAEAIKARYPDAFAVRIDGESMSPEILHGDLVILSPGKPAVAGRAAVVQIAGAIGVTCKLYHPAGDNVHLVPINETFPPVAAPADQIEWALQVLARIR